MSKKFLIIILVAVILAGAGGFFASRSFSEKFGANIGGAFRDHQEGDFSGRFDSMRGMRGMEGSSNPLFGEIISQGEGSFTIKLSDGSTRIIFISDSTQITKSIDGILGDLEIAGQIFVSGEENPDGSYTAKTIQIRP